MVGGLFLLADLPICVLLMGLPGPTLGSVLLGRAITLIQDTLSGIQDYSQRRGSVGTVKIFGGYVGLPGRGVFSGGWTRVQ